MTLGDTVGTHGQLLRFCDRTYELDLPHDLIGTRFIVACHTNIWGAPS